VVNGVVVGFRFPEGKSKQRGDDKQGRGKGDPDLIAVFYLFSYNT
jgi:hypothetical protein